MRDIHGVRAMPGEPPMPNKVLIAGASGVVGAAAVEAFLRLPGWEVVALSRREPEVTAPRPWQFLPWTCAMPMPAARRCRASRMSRTWSTPRCSRSRA
jgi:nucleoside-diphosphate-sugar epimerase